ncbi:hypothetical protein [Bacillus sp. FJAT-44742]|uniref:hypothetical protein n=1 Tax=Bacillus sp. FJAT-44742 TaxID=2014005 RepID=UPI000C230CE7|nr:hypothetical protein [Bacillus sp. FJAT-44742]
MNLPIPILCKGDRIVFHSGNIYEIELSAVTGLYHSSSIRLNWINKPLVYFPKDDEFQGKRWENLRQLQSWAEEHADSISSIEKTERSQPIPAYATLSTEEAHHEALREEVDRSRLQAFLTQFS